MHLQKFVWSCRNLYEFDGLFVWNSFSRVGYVSLIIKVVFIAVFCYYSELLDCRPCLSTCNLGLHTSSEVQYMFYCETRNILILYTGKDRVAHCKPIQTPVPVLHYKIIVQNMITRVQRWRDGGLCPTRDMTFHLIVSNVQDESKVKLFWLLHSLKKKSMKLCITLI